MIKRCVSLSLAVLLLAMLTAPALAAGGDQPVTSTGTFWSHFVASNPHNPYCNAVIGFLDPSVCTVSDDGRHHGKIVGKGLEPGAWWAKCDLCSQRFRVYDDDMQKAYEGKVGELPSSVFSSDGALFFKIPVLGASLTHDSDNCYVICDPGPDFRVTWSCSESYGGYKLNISLDEFVAPFPGSYRLAVVYLSKSSFVSNPYVFVAPSSGLPAPLPRYCWIDGSNVVSSGQFTESSCIFSAGAQLIPRGAVLNWSKNPGTYSVSGSVLVCCEPAVLPSGYDIDTRVGTFSGNFGYYGDNGQMILAENISIVNETNNTFHNPVTGDTAPVSSWTYNYGDRSYDITLDTGDTVTVTYGDENVTIVQGGNTYNVYYIVEQGGGEPEPTPTPPPTPTPTPPVPTPTVPPGPEPTEPVDPDAPPDTSGWGILDFLKGIFDFLFGLVKKILDGLSALIQKLLQPSEESINKLQSQIEEKLPFISDLKGFGDDFANALKNPLLSAADNQYTTVVDIGAKKGGVSYGTGQVNLLDVSWYLEYKPLGDAIIEGVCWLSFLWNLYGAVPGIIHGAASGVYSTGEIKRWKDGHEE